MRRDNRSGLVVNVLLVTAFAVGCGASGSGGPVGGGGRDGGGDAEVGAGGSDGGVDVPVDAPVTLDAVDSASTDAADASDAIADAGPSDLASDVPVFDAGAGCVAPVGEAPLVPTTEGFPAAGLVLWLRADRGVHKTAANAVCAWVDQSGNGAVLARSTTRPTWAATAVADNKPAIHFAGTGQDLATSGVLGIAPLSARTYIAVTALVTPDKRFAAVMQGQASTPGTYLNIDTNTFQTAGSREGVYAMNNAYDAALATSTALRVHVYTMGTSGPLTVGTPILPAIDYRVNGATQTLTRTPGGLGNGNFESFAGANFTAVGASAADAFLAEVLVYDRALTVAERQAVEAALTTRYAIP